MLNGDGTFSLKQRKHWKKYFHIDEASDTIQMKDFLRQKPVYKKLDLVKDSNLFLVNFDLIVCRNVIIYFNAELQNRVFDLFHKNLNEHGSLLLGVHESIMGSYSKKFIRKDPFYYKALV
jgi:chemotaxis methyl-accepting protein methylase